MRRRVAAHEILQVVLDDAAVARLREAAEERGIEVEQLIVGLLHTASYDVERIMPLVPLSLESFGTTDDC